VTPFSLELPRLVMRGGKLLTEGSRPFVINQGVQILNVGDFCNSCGKCDTFCPTSGAPYKDKPRFWIDAEGYSEAPGDVFRMSQSGGALILEARIGGLPHRLERCADITTYRSDILVVRFATGTWQLLGYESAGEIGEGCVLDLAPIAMLIALLGSASAVPALAFS